MAEDAETETAAWTAYWRTGQVGSCFEGADAEVQFAAIWASFVDLMPDKARLLDLAAGNGAASRLCVQHARARGLSVHVDAVDAAEVAPPTGADAQIFADITFRPNVRLEALPYPDDTFHGVLSQFGFEYAQEEDAAREAARVLAPGGRLRLVMHAREGAVAHAIQARVERLERVLARDGAATLALRLARAAEAQDRPTLQRLQAQLPGAIAAVRDMSIGAPPDDAAVFYARAFLEDWERRARYAPADLRRAIEAGWQNASGVAARQRQMLKAARSSDDVSVLCERLGRLGLTPASPQKIMRDAGGREQIAWLVDAAKAPRG